MNDFKSCFMLAGFKLCPTFHLRHVNAHDSWTRADGYKEENIFSDLDFVVEFSNCSEKSQFLNWVVQRCLRNCFLGHCQKLSKKHDYSYCNQEEKRLAIKFGSMFFQSVKLVGNLVRMQDDNCRKRTVHGCTMCTLIIITHVTLQMCVR